MSLDELRLTFRRKAHTAAMERCLTALLRERADLEESDLREARLRQLPDGPHRDALLRRREALGLPLDDDARVLVDHDGRGWSRAEVPLAVRRARSTRISIDGNAHFCGGLLRTRYPGSEEDQVPRTDGAEGDDPAFVPLSHLTAPPSLTASTTAKEPIA